MSMKPVKKVVASLGKYTDHNGNEKTRYLTVGKLLQRDDGSHCIKLDAMPVGEFSGWLNLYDLDEDRQQQQAAQPNQYPKAGPDVGDGENIPF